MIEKVLHAAKKFVVFIQIAVEWKQNMLEKMVC